MEFKFGLEVEVPLVRKKKRFIFVDFLNTSFNELSIIIKKIPKFKSDYKYLRIGDLKIKEKRIYIEGYERFYPNGSFRTCLIKGLEIRTTPHLKIEDVLKELRESYFILKKHLLKLSFFPTWISFNPFKKHFEPSLNKYEKKMRKESPESLTANLANLTFGPDFNFSIKSLDDKKLIDIAMKLTYYSPFIVPFSFSSPFFNKKLWRGYSYRTYKRTGLRPSCLVFLNDSRNMIKSFPSLTQISRIEAEKGRIEFKAFDTCGSLKMYQTLFILLKGLILDDSLKKRSLVPNYKAHKISALYGFKNELIKKEALKILSSVMNYLDNKEKDFIYFLKEIVLSNNLPVLKLIDDFKKSRSIIKTLLNNENISL